LAAVILAAQPVLADTATWTLGADGDWTNSAGWTSSSNGTPCLPQATDSVRVTATTLRTVTLDTATPNLYQTYLGVSASEKGALHILPGATYWATGVRALCVGYSGLGSVTQEANSLVATTTNANPDSTATGQDMVLAYNPTAVGRYTMNGGRFASGRDLFIGQEGAAEFFLNGGQISWNRTFTIANYASSTSTLTIAGGTLGNNRRPFNNGDADGGAARVRSVGSAATIIPTGITQGTNGTLRLELDNAGIAPIRGTATLNGGTLSVGFKDSAALLASNTFLVVTGAVTGDFVAKPDTNMWTTSTNLAWDLSDFNATATLNGVGVGALPIGTTIRIR
jgi:hypothetical protein